MIVQAIRSLLFYALFLGQTAILAIIVALLSYVLPGRMGFGIAVYWFHSSLFLLRWVVGIRTRVTGAENIPKGGCLIAAKHQSDWDILALLPHLPRPAFIAKKELMDIPFFGRAARKYETITIDRKRGGEAMPQLIEGVRGAMSRDCEVVIYPEGTRRMPLADPAYRWGTAKLYSALNVPVVPVALNSGLFWGRNSLILWPGTAEMHIMPPIPPGLDTETFQARLVETIETESDALIQKAVDAGLARPFDSEMRERLAARTQGKTLHIE
ncbi:lysophospholipid acyltransferase family protein [Cucumibacter marinus]|uniref:lysophospholipid acyltransferase family protein n=1 Tax=Cucumibacter marinus TaxID=1121252 RepID=UPI0004242A3C|nr:lysophospholipid acyltransferase family protein [Cucumibacter marinus]